MTAQNPKAVYACLNAGQTYTPKEILSQSIAINHDIGGVFDQIVRDALANGQKLQR